MGELSTTMKVPSTSFSHWAGCTDFTLNAVSIAKLILPLAFKMIIENCFDDLF